MKVSGTTIKLKAKELTSIQMEPSMLETGKKIDSMVMV